MSKHDDRQGAPVSSDQADKDQADKDQADKQQADTDHAAAKQARAGQFVKDDAGRVGYVTDVNRVETTHPDNTKHHVHQVSVVWLGVPEVVETELSVLG